MNWTRRLIFAGSIFLLGCGAPAEPPQHQSTPNTQGISNETSSAESSTAATATDSQDADQPKTNLLAIPEGTQGLRSQVTDSYERIRRDGFQDASQKRDTAILSQSIAIALTARDQALATDFYRQSGELLGEAIADGAELPGQLHDYAGQIFYNLACAYARQQATDKAMDALSQAVTYGFSDFELLTTDSDLASLHALPDFGTKVDAWRIEAKTRMAEQIQSEMSQFESFPFEFEVTDFDGNLHSLAGLQGKVALVDIWGTWCPPCRAEIPSFVKLQEKYGEQGFQIIGLNYQERSEQHVEEFIAAEGINYPCAMGDEATREQIPGFQGYPTTLFLDRTGKVRLTAVGAHPFEYLEAVITILLEEA